MRRAILASMVLTASLLAQANFDTPPICLGSIPSPCGAAGDPELVSWDGSGAGAGNLGVKADVAQNGFPVSGPQYAKLACNGPVAVAFGGPLIRPAAAAANELCIPIPAGATYVSFHWDYYNGEGVGSGFNDGMSIDIVTAGGALIQNLAYADNQMPTAGAGAAICGGGGGSPIAPPGPQYVGQHFTPLPGGAYLSVCCWNNIDNVAAGFGVIDDVRFGTTPIAVTFDEGAGCGYVFPSPIGTAGDAEGVSWNAPIGGATTKGVGNGCGFPIGGCGGYLRTRGNGGVTAPPAGGPIARPLDVDCNEVAVPLPAGTTDISFCWDLYTDKSVASTFNDGMSIDIVAAGGAPVLVALAYADTHTPSGPCADTGECAFGAGPVNERLPAGPQYLRRSFPPIPAGAYLSIATWNGGDNGVSPIGAVDNIRTGGPGLDYVSPGGAGSLALQNLGFGPGDFYFTIATLNGAGFPNGWFFGINPSIFEVLSQASSATPPFSGGLNGCGSSAFCVPAGIPAGIPAYLVTVTTDPAGNFREASAPFFLLTL